MKRSDFVCVAVDDGQDLLPSVFGLQWGQLSAHHLHMPSQPGWLKNRKTTARITSPRGWINQVSIHKSLESTWRMSMFAQDEKKTERHLKIYIYSESVRDQTAKLIFSSLNACSAPSLQFHYSPSIDFPHGPSPWRLQAGPLSPLLRLQGSFDCLGQWCAQSRAQSPIHTHIQTHTLTHTIIYFFTGPSYCSEWLCQGPISHLTV